MKIVCYGELLCDMTGKENRTFQMNAGGAPANCAVAAKKAGASSVSMCCKVGDDLFGSYLLQTLKKEGVETENVIVERGAHTTLAFVTLTGAEREFSFYRLADQQITGEDIDRLLLPEGGIFHFGSLSLTGEPIYSSTLKAVKAAREKGNLISFDVNFRDSLWADAEEAKRRILGVLPLCDIVKISDTEGEFLTGEADAERAAALLKAQGVPVVVLTMGRDGSALYAEGVTAKAKAFPANAVDTTGAGDCFYGTLLAEISKRGGIFALNKGEAEEILRTANAAGSLAVEGYGAIPSYPRWEDVLSRRNG